MGKGRRLLSVMCFVLALAVAVTAQLPVVMPMEQVEAATKASMNKKSVTLFKGKSVKLKVTGVNGKAKWSSSKKSVATVSNGKVKAKKKGTAVITANINGQKCTCKVTVEDPKINFKTAELYEDETLQLKVNGTKQTVKWKSSNKKIVAISSNGKVKAKSSGKATITARIGNVKLTCKITVEEEDDEDEEEEDEDDYEDEEEEDDEEYDDEEDLVE